MSYQNYPNTSLEVLSMLPQETTLFIQGRSLLFEQPVYGGGSQKFITNSLTDERYLWMNLMDKSFLVILPEKLPQPPTPRYEKTGSAKFIAGFSCSEINVITHTDTTTIWVSSDLHTGVSFQQFPGLEGFPLQYETRSSDGSKIILTAISVIEMPISQNLFERPTGMAQLSLEEFQQTFIN